MRTAWDSEGVEPREAVAPTSARGNVAQNAALRSALNESMGPGQRVALNLAQRAGAANFTLQVPVAQYQGRGATALDLNLVYNSRVWQKIEAPTPSMVFDIDQDWPAPGWNLGMGKLVRVSSGAMLVESDGTRRPFRVKQASYESGVNIRRFDAYTVDGANIRYTVRQRASDGTLLSGLALRTDGTKIIFGASGRFGAALYAETIVDRNGNRTTITYVDGHGPKLESIVDTCGRRVEFMYSGERLYAITGTPTGSPGQRPTEELLRLEFSSMTVQHSFGIDVADYEPGWGLAAVPIVTAILRPATSTGYYFKHDGDYSTYGMLRTVRSCRAMTMGLEAGIEEGLVSRLRQYDYPDAGAVIYDAPRYEQLRDTWVGQEDGPAITSFATSNAGGLRRTAITWPDGAKSFVESRLGTPTAPSGPFERISIFDATGTELESTTAVWGNRPDGSLRLLSTEKLLAPGSETELLNRITYYYSGDATEPSIVDEFEYGSLTRVARRTIVDYLDDQNYLARNMCNLPKRVRVIEGFDIDDPGSEQNVVWRVDLDYDRSALIESPGAVSRDVTFARGSDLFDPASEWRGNVTSTVTYGDAKQGLYPHNEYRTFDECGNLREVVLGGGATWYDYGAKNQYLAPLATRLGTAFAPDSTSLRIHRTEYNPNGQPRSYEDANSQKVDFEYDRAGRLSGVLNSASTSRRIVYDDAALKRTARVVIDGVEEVEEIAAFDGRGTILSLAKMSPNGMDIREYGYDLIGRLRWISLPYRESVAGAIYKYSIEYDGLGRIVRRKEPTGEVTSWHYDEVTRPGLAEDLTGATARVVDPVGNEKWYMWDSLGRVTQIVGSAPGNSLGPVLPTGVYLLRVKYDGLSNATESTMTSAAGSGQVRRFRYDSLGRLTHIFIPELGDTCPLETAGGEAGWSRRLSYDRRSNVVSDVDSRGVETRFVFEPSAINRLQRVEYDLTGVVDKSHPVVRCPPVHYDYVNHGDTRRISRVIIPGVGSETYEYDDRSDLHTKAFVIYGLSDFPLTVDYKHDTSARPNECLYPTAYGDDPAHRLSLALTRAADGRPVELLLDGQSLASEFIYGPHGLESITIGSTAPQRTERYTYYPTGEIRTQQVWQGAYRLTETHYSYWPPAFSYGEQVSRRIFEISGPNMAPWRRFDYDSLGRLVACDSASGWGQRYEYDAFGNRTSIATTGVVPPDGFSGPLSYDPHNRLHGAGFDYDAAGNLTARVASDGSEFRYRYDAAGRLAVATNLRSGSSLRYVYGACRRRRATLRLNAILPLDQQPPQMVDDHGVDGATVFAWDELDNVIAEYELGRDPENCLQWRRWFVYLGNRLLVTIGHGGSGFPAVQYEHASPSGTNYLTWPDGGGSAHHCLPFGNPPLGRATFGFAHYRRDEAVALDYAANRFYVPELGRFAQPDPFHRLADVFDPVRHNRYLYCNNDPINRTDRLGLLDDQDPCADGSYEGTVCGPIVFVYGYPESSVEISTLNLPTGPIGGGGGDFVVAGAAPLGGQSTIRDVVRSAEIYELHHILPQAFKAWFESRGIDDIHKYTKSIVDALHSFLHNTAGYNWNGQWEYFKWRYPAATVTEIFNFAHKLMKPFDLHKLPYVHYRRQSSPDGTTEFGGGHGESGGGGASDRW